MTRRLNLTLFAVVLSVTLVAAACGSDTAARAAAHAHQSTAHTGAPSPDGIDPVELRQDMRKLWEDHIVWTRLFIVSAVAGLPDTDATAGRLLQNQADIGNAIAGFYGDDAGAALTELLREHILVAADLVTAANAHDDAAVAAASESWYDNADEIAGFLADANPAWRRGELKRMMRTHLDQTLAEAIARLEGDWAADIAAYDHIHDHILVMADTLAAGIIEQFPDRFAG